MLSVAPSFRDRLTLAKLARLISGTSRLLCWIYSETLARQVHGMGGLRLRSAYVLSTGSVIQNRLAEWFNGARLSLILHRESLTTEREARQPARAFQWYRPASVWVVSYLPSDGRAAVLLTPARVHTGGSRRPRAWERQLFRMVPASLLCSLQALQASW